MTALAAPAFEVTRTLFSFTISPRRKKENKAVARPRTELPDGIFFEYQVFFPTWTTFSLLRSHFRHLTDLVRNVSIKSQNVMVRANKFGLI